MNFVDKRKLHDRITYLEKAVESMRRRQDQTLREMTQKLEMMGDILTMMSDTGTKPKRKSRRKGWKMPPWKGPPRYCDECKGPIPNERAHNAKYCSKECADERHIRLLKEEYARNKRTAKGVGGSAGSLFSGLDN